MTTSETINHPIPMKLILQHASNPDIPGGYWETPQDKRLSAVNVATVEEAQAAFVAWRDRNGLGGGNMTRRCGEVWKDKDTLAGRISYNGRFWPNETLTEAMA